MIEFYGLGVQAYYKQYKNYKTQTIKRLITYYLQKRRMRLRQLPPEALEIVARYSEGLCGDIDEKLHALYKILEERDEAGNNL